MKKKGNSDLWNPCLEPKKGTDDDDNYGDDGDGNGNVNDDELCLVAGTSRRRLLHMHTLYNKRRRL